jgi:abortive infection bacteriophage resistance protein
MKKPTTFEEQLHLLKSRGLVIGDEDKCLDFLRSVNYYRLSAYLLPFKQKDDTYFSGTTFEKVHRIYEFDRKLRSLLFSVIEEIELYLRSQLAYYSAHAHGALAYLDEKHYSSRHDHERFMQVIDAAISNHRNAPVVQHNNAVYGGSFPVWVIVEFLSIGNLSHFYADWLVEDKKHIAKTLFGTSYPFVDSWMKCITVLRNRCAHYSRLYYSLFTDAPKIPPAMQYTCSGRVFDQLLMLKFLYPHKKNWGISFVLPLETLVNEYKDSVSFAHIGFPENWKELLEHTDNPVPNNIGGL